MATAVETDSRAQAAAASPSLAAKSAYYALLVLTLANVLNYLDRQIVSILAQSIKADLKLDDAELGFLLGTAFAVFYSVVGIAMGRISDGLPRRKVMAAGLTLWSAMTALGGAASSFASLGFARIGVGVGEAVANPCGHSLVAELFPLKNRAFALSVLLSGVFVGGAFAMFIGGLFLTKWPAICAAVPIDGVCGLAAWKAALVAVALPGVPLALAILAIREPPQAPHGAGSTAGLILREIAGAVPPFTMVSLHRLGGARALNRNLMVTAAIAVVAAALVWATGDTAQWASFGLGAYAVVTWGQIQSYRDKPLFSLTFGDPAFVLATASCAAIACIAGAANVWSAPYAMRTFHMPAADLGLSLGLTSTAGALLGVLIGGWITDKWRATDLRAPLGVAGIALTGVIPCVLVLLLVKDFQVFLGAAFFLGLSAALPSAAQAALIQDLVLPRMRGSGAASFSLVAIVISSGTGPYWAGKVSTLTGSLSAGLLSMLALAPIAYVLLWQASRRLPVKSLDSRRQRAEAAGEPPAGVLAAAV